LTQQDGRSLEEFVHNGGLRACFQITCDVARAAVCCGETASTVLAIDQPPEEQHADPEAPAADRTTLMVADGIFSLIHDVVLDGVPGVVSGVVVQVIHLAFLPVSCQVAASLRSDGVRMAVKKRRLFGGVKVACRGLQLAGTNVSPAGSKVYSRGGPSAIAGRVRILQARAGEGRQQELPCYTEARTV